MFKKLKSRLDLREKKRSTRIVEILHIDTDNSRALYKEHSVNNFQKHACQKLLKDRFGLICRKFNGALKDWAGDGGFATFDSHSSFGLSAHAAEAFLQSLPILNAQTATNINTDGFQRSVRLKAHRGEIFTTEDSSVDSASPENFDDFIKFEKKFAPKTNEFFITDELYKALPSSLKKRFDIYAQKVSADSIKTKLYLMNRKPITKIDNILKKERSSKISDIDWKYLKEHIIAQKLNIASRNTITRGLIDSIQANKKINSQDLFRLTLRGIYNYLRVVYKTNRFAISYWLPETYRGKQYLKMYDYRYPSEGFVHPSKRKILLSDNHYKACQAFNSIEPIATPSVKIAYNKKEWQYFDDTQKTRKRDMASAIQIPVFFKQDDYDDLNNNIVKKGVLSIDSDRTNMFLQEERNLWVEEVLHYLVNLCLASTLYENEL